METFENSNHPTKEIHQGSSTVNSLVSNIKNLFFWIIIFSFIFGSAGGVFGSLYLSNLPSIQKIFKKSLNSQISTGSNITLSEDSAIIDVVKQKSSAVVSIVVSQDLNKIPGYGMNPDMQDPFFNYFFGSGSSNKTQQQPTSPNVQEVAAGTGFFVSSDGLIITNKHVVDNTSASYTVLTADGTKYDAKVLARDPVNDLAMVKIDIKNAPKLDLSDSSKLQVGQRVIAIGNSLGQYQNTVTSGIISGIGRKITAGGDTGSENLSGVIQTDAAINPGNSGGPLLNMEGQVVGINTAIDQQGQLVGFAIPANDINKDLVSFEKNGKISRPFLGVRYIMINGDLAKQEQLPQTYGALILRGQTQTDFAVVPGSPADKAGLVENDIILSAGGKKLDENFSLSDALKDYNVGDKVTLHVYHKGEEKDVQIILGETK